MKKSIAALLVLTLLVSSCASSKQSKKDTSKDASQDASGSLSSSVSEEIAIGEKINLQILSSFYPYTDPKVVGYVDEIGRSLAAHAERRELPYRFTILYNDQIYATSAPGGFVYLTTGMMHFLGNESELAAVLAHEIGELQYRDPRLSKSRRVLNSLMRSGAAVGPAFGHIGVLAVLGLAMMHNAVEAKGGALEPAERLREADKRAFHYMVEAGYDPQGLLDLLYSFLNADKQFAPFFYDYYQARPISEDRMGHLLEIFKELPLEGKTFTADRENYLERTRGIREIYKR